MVMLLSWLLLVVCLILTLLLYLGLCVCVCVFCLSVGFISAQQAEYGHMVYREEILKATQFPHVRPGRSPRLGILVISAYSADRTLLFLKTPN